MKVARWAYLLEEDPDFKRWYRNMAMASEGTASQRARILYRFLRKNGLTLEEFTEMGKRSVREVEDLLMDFVSEQKEEGRTPGYISNYLKTVRSWFKFNGVLLVRTINTGNTNSTPTIDDERTPRPDAILQVMNYGSTRSRCSISFIALAGLRPMTLGNHNGSDGLEVRDLPELQLSEGSAHFSKIPTRVVVRAELSKTKMQYESFLSSEGCELLKAYLEMRMANGEELDRNSAIISVAPGYERSSFRIAGVQRGGHVSTKTVTKDIRKAIRPKFKWRPYVMRSYFATRLLVAESNVKMTHSYRQFFMGHAGDMLARYTVNKGKLPEELIEDMRKSFANSEEYLALRKASGEDPELTTIRTMVESGVLDIHKPNVRDYLISKLGIEDAKQRAAMMMSETGLKEDEAMATVIIGALGLTASNITREPRVKNTTKIVNENELPEYLTDGWKIDTPLPSGNIVIKKFTYY